MISKEHTGLFFHRRWGAKMDREFEFMGKKENEKKCGKILR